MRVTQVEVDITWGRLGIHIKDPDFKLNKNDPELKVITHKDVIEIEQQPASVEVDMYPSYHDLGFKKHDDLAEGFAQDGKNTAHQETARYAQTGDRLMKDIRPETIAELAKERTHNNQPYIDLVYIRGPEFSVNPHRINVDHANRGVDSELQRGTVETDLKWGKVEPYLVEKPQVEYDTTKSIIDLWI